MTHPVRRILTMAAFALACACVVVRPSSAFELAVCADPQRAPYSLRDESGFDNRIAAIVAAALDADLRYVWVEDGRSRTALRLLHAGACDMAMGVIDGQSGYLTSHAYYRTGYVFVYPVGAGYTVSSMDDSALRTLRIGLPGGAHKPTPPSIALARRGLIANLTHFGAETRSVAPGSPVLDALKDDRLDVAIVWGPSTGQLRRDDADEYAVAPVKPEIDIPFLPMVASMAIGVRPHDEALRDNLNGALASRWEEIQAVLVEAGVPLLFLPRPMEMTVEVLQ
jgi:mxaJ protein